MVILTGGVILLVILIAWFLPLDDDFSVENPSWNGSKALIASNKTQSLESFDDLPLTPRGTTLILIPYLELTSGEREQLKGYITSGGRLILADDYGYGNQILEYLGLEVRFSGEVLADSLINYKTEYFPKIIHFKSDPLTINIESLVLNHATCLVNIEADSAIALSSSFSFLDRNENGTQEDDEPSGPLPVIYREKSGEGEMILVADPSLFINCMSEIDENEGFIRNIADTTASLYIDQSHLPKSDLHQTKSLLARIREHLASPLITAGLVALAIVLSLKPIWNRGRENSKK
jgi:hypothetical protein